MAAKASPVSYSRGGAFGPTVIMVLLLVPNALLAYPVFGTKRYGRSGSALPHHRVSNSWGIPAPLPMQPYQQPQPRAAQTHYGLAAPAYYADPIISYPYAQEYPETDYIYAPQEPLYNAYPYYGGVPKYSTYQNIVPYYYGDGRHGFGGYYNYDEVNDPVDDLQEEIQQEEEREEREEALPIGQETWFEGQQPQQHDSIADVNAAFLQNLIMSHIYNDRHQAPGYFGSGSAYADFDYGTDGWFYDTPVSTGERGHSNTDYYQNSNEEIDDEDVRELKSLVKKNRSGEIGDHETSTNRFSKSQQDWYSPPAHQYYEPTLFVSDTATPWYEGGWGNEAYFKRNYNDKKYVTKKQESSEYGPWIPSAKSAINFSDRKGNSPVVARLAKTIQQSTSPSAASIVTSSTTTTTPKPSTTAAPDFDPRRGQKEVALLRPPTPIRHSFKSPAMDRLMTTRSRPEERHGPSVYETIKQLLNMENKLHKYLECFSGFQPGPEGCTLQRFKDVHRLHRQGLVSLTMETMDVFETLECTSFWTWLEARETFQGTESAVQPRQHPRPQKRFVSNEESLVEELSGLKKLAA